MNEEAIKDAHGLFVNTGYKGSIDDFKKLLASNPDALKDAHKLFTDTGYKGDEDEFSGLMGLKKKDNSTVSPTEVTVLDSLSTVGDLVNSTTEPTEEKKDTKIFKDPRFWLFNALAESVASGIDQGNTSDEALNVMFSGDVSDETIQKYIDVNNALDERGPSQAMVEFNKDFDEAVESGDSEVWAFIEGVAKNPLAAAEVSLSSMAAMAASAFGSDYGASITLAGGAAGAGAGAGLGAAAGAIGGPLAGLTAAGGAVAGSVRGMMSAAGGLVETTSSFTEFLKEELGDNPFTKENVKAVLEDPEKKDKIVNRALSRGATIATVDLLTSAAVGKAAKATKGLVSGGASGKAAVGVVGTTIEGVGGGLGEVSARVVADQPMDVREIGFEVIGELGTAPIDIALGLKNTPKYSINESPVKKSDIIKRIDTATDEELSFMNIQIDNDEILSERLEARMERARVSKDIDPAITDDSDKKEVVDKEIEIRKLKNKDTRSAKQRVKILEGEIDEIQSKYTASKEEEIITEPKPVTYKQEVVSDVLNRPVTLTKLGGSAIGSPIEGNLYVEGQQVIIEDSEGNITELGNIDEVSSQTLDQAGIEIAQSELTVLDNGNFDYKGEVLVPNKKGIKINKKGDITSVTLRNKDGSVTKTLRGANAEEAAYNILLKEAESPEQSERINQLLEQNEEFKNQLGETEAVAQEPTSEDIKLSTGAAEGNRLFSEPLQEASTIANRIGKRKGFNTRRVGETTKLDKTKSTRIAKAFDEMESTPNDPKTKKAYQALIDETLDQYNEIVKDGYKVEINNEEPYNSSGEMIQDLQENKRMKIFSTESGFGETEITDEQRKNNPLLQETGLKDVNGKPLLANDVFRFVHDFFGHSKEGNSFGPKGEEVAWNVHSQMYSKDARRALTTETRGQNSWVNFSGVNEEAFKIRDKARALREQAQSESDINKKKSLLEEAKGLVEEAYDKMSFAEQKIGLLPDEFVFEQPELTPEQYSEELSKAKKEGDQSKFWAVDNVPAKEAAKGTILQEEDGALFVSENGEVKGLYKRKGFETKGLAKRLLKRAVEAGGIKLDNFDLPWLTKPYKESGFKVVGRMDFNEEIAPEEWKPEYGKPDVVAMVYDPTNALGIEEKRFTDYDEMIAYRDNLIIDSKVDITVEEIQERSEKAIKSKVKGKTFKDLKLYTREVILDRQAHIKNLLKGVSSTKSLKATALLVTKAGATGYANYRFKQAEKKIYKGLSDSQVKALDRLIYAKRIEAINKNRQERKLEPYRGLEGYSLKQSQSDLTRMKLSMSPKEFSDLSNRADEYFNTYKETLTRSRDAGLISEKVHDDLINLEYSPIKTIKYMLAEDFDAKEVDRMAASIGMSQSEIKSLSDENANEIITDSRWLLMTNIASAEARIFENRMLNAFDDAINSATESEKESIQQYVLDNPIVDTKKDGTAKRKYDKKPPLGYTKVFFKKNGADSYLVVDRRYARQLLDVKTQYPRWFDKAINLTGVKVLRFFATGGNPLFIVTNTAVDLANVSFLSDTYSNAKITGIDIKPTGTITLINDFTKNFAKKVSGAGNYNELYKDFMEHGGGMEYLSVDGLKALQGLKPTSKIIKGATDALKAYGNAAAYLGESSEIATRLSVYDKELTSLTEKFKKENGTEPSSQELEDIKFEAARISRETIDFSQGGSAIKALDKFFPYLNAATQGFRKAVDYASENPVGFANSAFQYAAMSAAMSSLSMAFLMARLEDDDEKEKVLDVLDSVTPYEKANYHILFTGEKNEDGEYSYIRVKKHPILSVISTLSENLVTKAMLGQVGVDYKMDDVALLRSLENAAPFTPLPSQMLSRNPVVAGYLSYTFNKDLFTGNEIFHQDSRRKILPSAEGMEDDKINLVYKHMGEFFGLSPARSKVAFEKVITSEKTNPTVGLFYSAYDGLFNSETDFGKEVQNTGIKFLDNSLRRVTRTTNKNVIKYNRNEDVENIKEIMDTDIYLKEQKVYSAIKKKLNNKEDITNGDLVRLIKENFDPIDHEKYAKKYVAYIKNKGNDREMLDILFESNPEVQAYRLFNRFGEELDEKEIAAIRKSMSMAGRKLSKKALYIYNKEYKKSPK